MKICLDLRYKTESGGSSYIKNVVPALLSQGREHRFIGVITAGQQFPHIDAFEKVLVCPSNDDLTYMGWTMLRLPSLLREERVDLYHGMKLPGPFKNPVPTIHTMHSVLRDKVAGFPSTFKAKAFIAVYGQPILKHLHRFIAVSGFVRADLMKSHGIPADRIDVVPHGVSPRFRRLTLDAVRVDLLRFSLRRYVLSVGNVFPVKNHLTALRAFARLAPSHPELDFAIAGGLQDAYAGRVRAEIASLGLGNRVKLLGMLSPEDLVSVLNGAELLLFPSLTEGFGIAVLEAMACGVPVVSSRAGALGELAATAFVDDPMDDAGFAAEAGRLLSDPVHRGEAAERSAQAASRFTWENSAREHLASYERAVETPRP